MKIIISHVFSKENKGDAALLSVLINDLKNIFDNPKITILTIDQVRKNEKFEEVPVRNAFMYWAITRYENRALKLLYAFFVMASTLLWAVLYRIAKVNLPLPSHLQELCALYRETNLIAPVGGGYLRGNPEYGSTVILLLLLHPLLLSAILGKPTILYAQSIGPFGSKLQRYFATYILKKMDGIIVREDVSFTLLQRFGLTNMTRSIDSGFSLSTAIRRDLHADFSIPRIVPIIGVTVRKWLNQAAQAQYEQAVATFADAVIRDYAMTVLFIPQVTAKYHHDDDRDTAERVYIRMNEKEGARILHNDYDHYEIKAVYNDLDFVIGTRFHSVIFSLTSYVPAIAIEYEYKTSGIMHDLGLDTWVIKIEDVTAEKLLILFKELVAEQSSYKKHLAAVLPDYIKRAHATPLILKQKYEQYETVRQHKIK
ncbi:polysaccharide pyruvyl transferase family protein [Patescibacteria group bacterium]|nr:polysaccharide pyruvyl transferase family protein [Patescibacteria group bacterium]